MKKFDTGCEGMDKRTKAYRRCLEEEAAEKSLGDYVEDFTEATGIKKAVEWFSELTGIDCGCEERKEKLNNLFRRRRRVVNCMTKKQFVEWEHIRNNFSGKISKITRDKIEEIHNAIFNTKFKNTCTCNKKLWAQMTKDIDKVWEAYEYKGD